MFLDSQCYVVNFNVPSLPMYELHTGRVMFEVMNKVLGVLCKDWTINILDIFSDGARNMTGRNAGVVTNI